MDSVSKNSAEVGLSASCLY